MARRQESPCEGLVRPEDKKVTAVTQADFVVTLPLRPVQPHPEAQPWWSGGVFVTTPRFRVRSFSSYPSIPVSLPRTEISTWAAL